jgi:hypothetical protein
MIKRCPPGVLCIENVSMTLFLVILLVVGFVIYVYNLKKSNLINLEMSKNKMET